MTAKDLRDKYINFFKDKNHVEIPNSPLVPENDPTTLFTSSGMQPLIPYLMGEKHPAGTRLVDSQNSFRAVDIDEVGDNRHTTFFRMLGNWSLGDYFKKEEIPWLWEFLTETLGLPKEKLFITVFDGFKKIERDEESYKIWADLLTKEGFVPEQKIFFAGVDKNWWSRSGTPDKMPVGEIGGPDTEVYIRFDDIEHTDECEGDSPVYCECGKFLEIANSVFMQYKKVTEEDFDPLPNKNVDFGGGLERLLAAVELKSDIFETSLFHPTIKTIEKETSKTYGENKKEMQIITDHLGASVFIILAGVRPSNKEQGYILRRLLRRAFDNFYTLSGKDITSVIESVFDQYKETDEDLVSKYEEIRNVILEEEKNYKGTLQRAKAFISKKYPETGDEIMGEKKTISSEDAFILYSTHGLSPTQIKSLGFDFDEQAFAKKMEEHQNLSRAGAQQKFRGGLADTSEKTVMGHTATHLLHKALRDMFGEDLHQTGSNITTERLRFDFNFDRKLEDDEIKKLEDTINEKIRENLPVHFEILPLEEAKKLGAIGLFDEKYGNDVKVYFVGDYSKEFCGGPHVDFTSKLKRFKIIRQENIGHGQRRIYAVVG